MITLSALKTRLSSSNESRTRILSDLEAFLKEKEVTSLNRQIIILKASVGRLEKDQISGIISSDEYRIESNKIINRIISLIELADLRISEKETNERIEILEKPDRKNKIVLLAGAGASDYIGYKILKNLPTEIKKKYRNKHPDSINVIQDTWNLLRQINGNVTVEDLIIKLNQYLIISQTIMKEDALRKHIAIDTGGRRNLDSIWRNALQICYLTLIEQYGPSDKHLNTRKTNNFFHYLKMLSSYNADAISIFTTNYDCSFQMIRQNKDIITNTNILSRIDKNNEFDENGWYCSEYKKEYTDIYINRLHGCVSWFYEQGAKGGIREDMYILKQKKLYNNYMYNMGIKLTSMEGIGAQRAFSVAFENFYKSLIECKILIVWGHSFRDQEVLIQISRALDIKKSPLYILCVEPPKPKDYLKNNIRRTLNNALEKIDLDEVKLEKIDWNNNDLDNDNFEKLMRSTKNTINEILKK